MTDYFYLKERTCLKELVCNIHNKENYVVHIRALQQALNHELILKKVHTKLRTYAKGDSEKDFFKDFLKDFFRRTMEDVRKHRDIKI